MITQTHRDLGQESSFTFHVLQTSGPGKPLKRRIIRVIAKET